MPIYFQAIAGKDEVFYPAWRYHKYFDPVLVHNTDEDETAKGNGWESIEASVFAPSKLKNFGPDFEELSPRQLCLYAKSKFNIDLSPKTSPDKLIQALYRLYTNDPGSKDDVVLLAQSMEMDLDQTMAAIRENVKNPSETINEVFYA